MSLSNEIRKRVNDSIQYDMLKLFKHCLTLDQLRVLANPMIEVLGSRGIQRIVVDKTKLYGSQNFNSN
jgi:hypothetical protein